jgi:hypothetical protein
MPKEETMKRTIARSAWQIVALGLLLALAASWGASRAAAASMVERPSPLIGLARGQTARLNVVNYEGPDSAPVQVELAFFDDQGNPLARSEETLAPGRAAALELPYERLGRADLRLEVRALMRVSGDPNVVGDPHIIPSLEVFDDDTGKTQVLIGEFPPDPCKSQ